MIHAPPAAAPLARKDGEHGEPPSPPNQVGRFEHDGVLVSCSSVRPGMILGEYTYLGPALLDCPMNPNRGAYHNRATHSDRRC